MNKKDFDNIIDDMHYTKNGRVLSATCDFCKKPCDTNNPDSGIGRTALTFMCQTCFDISDALWQASDMMRDVREGELAEMEGSEIV